MLIPYKALLQKEWIKLRYVLLVVPILLIYATADTYFTLSTIQRVHEAFGLWSTLISKEPPLFDSFQYIVLSGFIIGFFQIWPETQGKNIRLLFHMPVEPAYMVGFMLMVGLFIIAFINILAALMLLYAFWIFHLPWEVLSSVLYAFLPFALLNFVSYMSVFAFCGHKKFGLLGIVILTCLIFYSLLWGISGYNLWREALHYYAFIVCGMIFLCFFTFLQAMGEPINSKLYTVSRMASLILFAILLSTILPSQYWRVYMPKSATQRLYYSPVHKQFVHTQTVLDANALLPSKSISILEDGTLLDGQALALALPTMHSENLLKWNMFPKEIDGKALSLQQIKYNWQYLSFSPRTINKPPLLLEMMLEANPKGANFEAPTDMFRIRHDKGGIEFFRPADGSIDIEKSTAFTKTLQEKGFVFPIMAYGGNPNIRKVYDAGYVFADASGQIFQLQMIDGKAHGMRIDGKITEKIRFIIIDENRRKDFFAYIITDTNVYAVKHVPLALVTLPLQNYALDSSYFYMWADPLQKTFVQGSFNHREDGIIGRAFTPDLAPEREYNIPMRKEDVQNMEFYTYIASALFPFRIIQRNPTSMYYAFDIQISKNILITIIANLFCMMLLAVFFRHKRKRIFDFIFVGFFGISGILILGVEAFSVRRN